MKDEYISVARNTLLIGNCPQDVADEILPRATVRSWDRGERIFAAGDDAQTIYIVLEG